MNKKCLFKTGYALTVLFWLLAFGAASGQSPWTRSKGGFYIQAAWHFIPAYETLYNASGGDRPLDRRISESTLQLYGEYGLNARTTVILVSPFRFVKAGDFLQNTILPETAPGTLRGAGNSSLGLRYKLLDKKIPLTISLRVDTPVERYTHFDTGLSTGYNAWTFLPMVSTGIGLRQGYGFIYGGYGYRTNDFSHFLNFGVEGGLKAGNAYLIGFSEWMHSLKNGDARLPRTNQLTGLYVNDQSYLSVGLKGTYQVNRFIGVFVTAAGVAYAALLPKSPGLGGGLFFKWE